MKNLLALFMLFGLMLNHPNVYSQTSPEYSDAQKICKDCLYQGYLVLANGDVLYIQQKFPDLKLFVYNSDLKFIRKGKIRIRDTWRAMNLNNLGGKLYLSYSRKDKDTETYMTALQEIIMPDFELGEEIVIETIPLHLYKDNKTIHAEDITKVPVTVYRKDIYNVGEFVLFSESYDDTLVVYFNNYVGDEFKKTYYDKNFNKIETVNVEFSMPNLSGLDDRPEIVYSSDRVHYGYFTYDEVTFSECFHTYSIKEDEVDNYYTHCWDKDWVWNYSGGKMLSNYNKAVSKGKEPRKLNFMMHSAVEFADGSVTYFLDQDYYISATNANSIGYRAGDPRMFGNIAILHYDQAGELDWKKIIPKSQASYPYSTRLGFRTIVMDDESVKIIFTTVGEKEGTTDLKVISVTPDGDLDTELNYQIPEASIYIRFMDGFQTSDSFYYMGYKNKNDQGLFRFPIQN